MAPRLLTTPLRRSWLAALSVAAAALCAIAAAVTFAGSSSELAWAAVWVSAGAPLRRTCSDGGASMANRTRLCPT